MLSLSANNQNDIEAFNSISRYLNDLFIIDNPYFEQKVCLGFISSWTNLCST